MLIKKHKKLKKGITCWGGGGMSLILFGHDPRVLEPAQKKDFPYLKKNISNYPFSLFLRDL